MASSLLVVDDDDDIRSVLEREGFRVTVAGNGDRALDVLRQIPVDCILLDAGPPGLEGLEMCRRLRDAGDETPIILLTAPAGVGQRVQGLEAGADDCGPGSGRCCAGTGASAATRCCAWATWPWTACRWRCHGAAGPST
jgi:CheY-like chemotaxis protein